MDSPLLLSREKSFMNAKTEKLSCAHCLLPFQILSSLRSWLRSRELTYIASAHVPLVRASFFQRMATRNFARCGARIEREQDCCVRRRKKLHQHHREENLYEERRSKVCLNTDMGRDRSISEGKRSGSLTMSTVSRYGSQLRRRTRWKPDEYYSLDLGNSQKDVMWVLRLNG
jgi:hypothetical protein